MARCQSKSIIEQLKVGTELIDLRFRFDIDDFTPYLCHGPFKYEGNVDCLLAELNYHLSITNKKLKVRVILETYKLLGRNESLDGIQIYLFKDFCDTIINKYSYLEFFGFYDKLSKKQIYQGEISGFRIDEDHSSVQMTKSGKRKWWLALCPWLWNKVNRGRILKELSDSANQNYLMIDFI